MRELTGLIAGLVFGTGLYVSGMIDPNKVLNFLDVAGTFDPSLAFVMGGAIPVAFIGTQIARRRGKPLFEGAFHWPLSKAIDVPLLTGAALFGAGWGLSGYCPGPALASLAFLAPATLVFAAALVAGAFAAKALRGGSGQTVQLKNKALQP